MTSDTALESPKFIFFNLKKIFIIRTHPKQLIAYINGTFVILSNHDCFIYINDQLGVFFFKWANFGPVRFYH